jgi:hypothetical protein
MAVGPSGLNVNSLSTANLGARTEVVYGSAGSFGALASASALPGGQSFATDAVSSWGFLPGQAVMGAVLGPDGNIVMGDEPQTSNQAEATASTMALSVFNPAAQTFQNVVIPTNTGATSVTEPGYVTGGADISAIASVPGKGNQVAFLSAWPYRGWSTSDGQYPTFGYVAPTGSGSYQYVAGSGKVAGTIAASDPSSTACTPQASSFTPALADCRGPASMAVLPGSGDIVVGQYYDNESAGVDSGGLMVMSPDGQLLGSYSYPNVTVNGQPRYVFPREVDVDPTSTAGHERFAVIFDVFTGANAQGQTAFAMQTFDFDSATGAITPESAPFLPGQSVGGSTAYFETAHFDQHGNLWAAESVVNAISGGNIVEYSAASVQGRLASGSCAASGPWNTTQWGETCAPDLTLTGSAGQGDVRSVTEDTANGSLYFATISGDLIPVRPTGQAGSPWIEGRSFDFGINELTNRNLAEILPRQGALDPTTGYLWLPVEQLESSGACNLGLFACQSTPSQLSQWLVRINVNQLGG